MNPSWEARRAELRGRNPLPLRPDADLDFHVTAPKVTVPQYPRPITPGNRRVRRRMAERHAPIPHRCGVVHTGPCSHALPPGEQALRWIGQQNDLGYTDDLYQCDVCHQVVTAHEAGIGW